LNSLIAGQLLGGVLFLVGVVLAAWSYANNQPMGQLFGGALILIGIVLAALAYNRRRRFVGTHERTSPQTVKPV
jgi:drug/metabolite transporter (DMT)-like permease